MLAQESSVEAMAGLSEQEATRRLRTEGYNELQSQRRRGFFQAVLEVAREPMFVLLITGVLVYLALGDVVEGLALLASVVGVIGHSRVSTGRQKRCMHRANN